jgi:hypothetical protein
MTQPSPVEALRASLRADRETLRAAVESVPAELRHRKPGPDRWSVAEVLEHLAIVQDRVLAMFPKLVESAPATDAANTATVKPFDREKFQNRDVKVTAAEAIRPTGTVSADEAWTRLERTRAEFLQVLETIAGRDLAQVSRQHPILGALDGYQIIAALGGHEERHAAQIREIGAQIRG